MPAPPAEAAAVVGQKMLIRSSGRAASPLVGAVQPDARAAPAYKRRRDRARRPAGLHAFRRSRTPRRGVRSGGQGVFERGQVGQRREDRSGPAPSAKVRRRCPRRQPRRPGQPVPPPGPPTVPEGLIGRAVACTAPGHAGQRTEPAARRRRRAAGAAACAAPTPSTITMSAASWLRVAPSSSLVPVPGWSTRGFPGRSRGASTVLT